MHCGASCCFNVIPQKCTIDDTLPLNSLARGTSGCDITNAFSTLFHRLVSSNILMVKPWYKWPQNLTDDKWILVQITAWCRQATSHYQSQCWRYSMSAYDVISLQWAKHIICKLAMLWYLRRSISRGLLEEYTLCKLATPDTRLQGSV